MKKILILIIGLTVFSNTSFTALAVSGECENPCPSGQTCDFETETCKNLTEVLTKRYGDNTKSPDTPLKEDPAGNVKDLPDVSLESIMATIIKALLGWSMIFTIVAIVVSAMYYLISQGKEENVSKAKNIILYLVIGMAIMAGAYGIISGITQFNFFQ